MRSLCSQRNFRNAVARYHIAVINYRRVGGFQRLVELVARRAHSIRG